MQAKFDVLREHCAREDTDYDRIRKTMLYFGVLEPDATGGGAFAEQMARYADVGVEEVHVVPYEPDPVGFVRGLGSHVIPAVEPL